MAVPHPSPINLAAVKTPSDYLRAMRRRIWLILAVAVPLAIDHVDLGTSTASDLPGTRRDHDRAPEFNPVLSTLVSHEIGRHDP